MIQLSDMTGNSISVSLTPISVRIFDTAIVLAAFTRLSSVGACSFFAPQ